MVFIMNKQHLMIHTSLIRSTAAQESPGPSQMPQQTLKYPSCDEIRSQCLSVYSSPPVLLNVANLSTLSLDLVSVYTPLATFFIKKRGAVLSVKIDLLTRMNIIVDIEHSHCLYLMFVILSFDGFIINQVTF